MIDLSPLREKLDGKPVAIVGLGKSGMPVFEACRKAGIDTVLWDDDAEQRKAAEKLGAKIKDLTAADLKKFAFLCLSPGVPLTHPKPHPAVERARDAGIEVLGDIELFRRAKPNVKTIGITGTNGKSTTTALIGHILREAGVRSAVGGNIGEAALTLPDLPKNSIYVLELSSYQIDLMTTFSPDISVLINISPDHLDRHGTLKNYAAVKEKIFRGPGIAIVGIDDRESAQICERARKKGERKVVAVSFLRPLMSGVFVSVEGMLFDGAEKVVDLNTCAALRGQHNWQNAAMAYAAARAADVEAAVIARALQSFPGLAHRQNIVANLNGVAYINDSKATNDQAAAMALRTFKPVYWIAGGKPKEGGYKDCEKYLSHVRHAFLIGEAEPVLEKFLAKKKVPFTKCGTLDRATEEAHRLAQKERIDHAAVLLSPACASFDQFRNFEHRGETFVSLVKKLTQTKRSKAG